MGVLGPLTPNMPRIALDAVVLMLLGQAVGSGRLAAQTLGAASAPGGSPIPGWLTQWSPLGLTGDLPRELPGGGVSLPSLLTLPAPRIGSFWTAGNPAAMPSDVRDSYAQFRLGHTRNKGEYKRPLDAGNDTRLGGTAFGWKELPANGAAIGRLVVDRLDQADGAHADVVLPHSSNPFVVLDTIGDEVAGIVVRLEGAGGWRVGNLGVGLGLGYEGREIRTVASPVPRQYRVSAAGITAGLDYELADGAFQFGVFGRWQQLAQTSLTATVAEQPTRIYVLSGYFEPTATDLAPGLYHRRFDRSGRALGIAIGGAAGGVNWTLYGQRDRLSEKQSVRSENEPPTDDWDADGWTAGLSVQLTLGDSLVLVTIAGRYSTLAGQALRMDLEQVNFQADEAEWYLGGELRYLTRDGWSGALSIGTGRDSRRRQDLLARVASDLNSWMPTASLEVARALPWGLAVSAGVGFSQYAPWGSVPTPWEMSPAYQEWIAPELSLYGTDASSFGGTATVLWRARPALSLWVQGRTASLSAETAIGRLPMAPQGSRNHSSIEFGVTMRP